MRQPLPDRNPCVVDRFDDDPEDPVWVVDGRYHCDAPSREPGTKIVRDCGRVIIVCIAEGGDKNFEPDPATPACAMARGTYCPTEQANITEGYL